MKICPICSKNHNRKRYTVCSACTNWYRRYTMKVKCVQRLGGKCIDCGESDLPCLEFHHRDPKQKEFKINYLFNTGYDKIEKEIVKCDLLCSNCHRKKHYNHNQNILDYYLSNTDYIEIDMTPPTNYKPKLSNRKVDRPSREELEILCQTKTLVEIANMYGVKPPSVGKWRKCYGLPALNKGYWTKKNERKTI